jgi:type IV fimbrial biogenesis protein FimT
MPSAAPWSRSAGVTLIEVAITVTILAILAAVALPAFNNVILANRLAAGANELVGSLQVARSEAIRRRSRVVVCASASGSGCGGSWSDGWIVFEDGDRNGTVSGSETVIRSQSRMNDLQVLASTNIGTAVVFRPDGMARQGTGALLLGRLSVCVVASGLPLNVRQIEMASGSRISLSGVNGAGTCATPANS